MKAAKSVANVNQDSRPASDQVSRRPFNDLRHLEGEKLLKADDYESDFHPPSFTLKELRDAIPPHLFQRSLIKSSFYCVVNLVAAGILFYLSTFIPHCHPQLRPLLWLTYWWFQGVAGFGLWIMAHECGHQAFSDYKTFNNVLGFVLHSCLLVPYHPWRISHAHHHSATGNLQLDTNYVPKRKALSEVENQPQKSAWAEAVEESPIYTFLFIVFVLLFGWQGHLIFNLSAQYVPGKWNTHLLPSSPLYTPRQKWQVLGSDFGVIMVAAVLGYVGATTSFMSLVMHYGVPYMVTHAWLVTVTYLHHTDVFLPHYSDKAWTFLRGALTTVDRDFGPFLNTAFHHIHDSHVVHHLFSTMPHYHAIQATPYLKEKLREYYLYDRTPVWKALFRSFKYCYWVEANKDIVFYRK